MRVFSGVSGVKSHSIPSNENAVCKRHNPPGDPSHAPTLRRSLAFLGVISAGGESYCPMPRLLGRRQPRNPCVARTPPDCAVALGTGSPDGGVVRHSVANHARKQFGNRRRQHDSLAEGHACT